MIRKLLYRQQNNAIICQTAEKSPSDKCKTNTWISLPGYAGRSKSLLGPVVIASDPKLPLVDRKCFLNVAII